MQSPRRLCCSCPGPLFEIKPFSMYLLLRSDCDVARAGRLFVCSADRFADDDHVIMFFVGGKLLAVGGVVA